MEYIKFNDAKLYYDYETSNITITEKYINDYHLLLPVFKEIQNYLSTCKEYEFNRDSLKLKFTIDENRLNIFNIFDKYKNLLENEKTQYVFILYGYWFSKLVITYFENYFNIKKLNNIMKDTLVVKLKCKNCHTYTNMEMKTYTDFFHSNEDYICEKCKEEIKKNKRSRD